MTEPLCEPHRIKEPPPIRYVECFVNGSLEQIELPCVVEVEINTRCNRHCSYCPVSIIPPPPGPRFLEDAIFERLVRELETISFDGRLSYHLYNEPLLRQDLERLIEIAAVRLPSAHQVLFTNGDLLTEDRYQSLCRAGIGEFLVTRHDGDGDEFPQRPLQNVIIPPQLDITNRGGTMSQTAHAFPMSCYAPTEMLIVTATGDVLLCYEDARRQNVMGNILNESLLDIWTSERFVRMRSLLVAGKRETVGGICATCDNRTHATRGHSWPAL